MTEPTDLIERLREAAANEHVYAVEQDFWHEEVLTEAADEITALRDRVAALEGALEPFACKEFEFPIVDDEGWSEAGVSWSREPINYWFGPTCFRNARSILSRAQHGGGEK